MLIAPPTRVVIGAGAHQAMTSWIAARRPALEIRGAKPSEVTADLLDWGEAYVGFLRPPVPTMGSIRWVHCTGAGVDSWLFPVELDRRILLTRTSESFGPMIAEWVMARILGASQRLLELAAAQAERRWSPMEIRHIAGSRALVVGMGDVGRAVTHRLQTFDVSVTAVARAGRTDSPLVGVVHPVSALTELVSDAQWIIVTLPLTASTRGLISRTVLDRCRGAFLINTGRGAVVDESALPEALGAGWLTGAALDVFQVEPLPAESPLWSDRRVMISPHISGQTSVEGAGTGFLECLDALERGVLPRWAVDREREY